RAQQVGPCQRHRAQDGDSSQLVLAAISGRGRSGGGVPRLPIWTSPATRSDGFTPRWASAKDWFSAAWPVSQAAPQPAASAAFTSPRQTAPADRICSHSGTFGLSTG